MSTKLILAGLLTLAAALPAQTNDFGAAIDTTLDHVRREPDAFKNVKVVFTLQYATLGKISNPFFTQFTPADYANFHGWSDQQPIWRRESYEDLFGMLFLSKMHPKLGQLYALRTYQRIRVTGVVRNTFQDAPWIEVLDFEPVSGQVDIAVLTHLFRGEQFMAQRRWQRAIAELSLAPGAGVPEPVLFAVYKNLGTCYLRIGEAERALTHLRQASGLTTEPDLAVERMLAVAATQPALELDRLVTQAALKDYERPMWEAFDRDAGKQSGQAATSPPAPVKQ